MDKVVGYNNSNISTVKIKMKNTKDKNIRETLRNILAKELETSRNRTGHPAHIFFELGVDHGKCRIDIATINGTTHGYEIKSDADTLDRLPEQADAYNKVFDMVTLVVGESHIIEALTVIPDWWGVKLAKGADDGTVKLSTIRKPARNPIQNKLSIARLLWKKEAIDLLGSIGKDYGVRTKRRELVYEHLAAVMDKARLKEAVAERLLSRVGS
jgi:hypothetical protein